MVAVAAHEINDKDARKLAKAMEKQGFEFRVDRKHVRIFAPNGEHVGNLGSSPGTPRWELAALRTLCRRWKVQL